MPRRRRRAPRPTWPPAAPRCRAARINLGYAQVTAPIAGRIGRALVTEGALVSAAEATQLALIQQTRTVYVNFTQSSGDVLRLRRAMAANQLRRVGADAVAVRVVLEDGSELPRPGKLLFSDLSVDASSGQVTLRAEVDNPDGLLLPGQYVRVRLAQAELPAGLPAAAAGRDAIGTGRHGARRRRGQQADAATGDGGFVAGRAMGRHQRLKAGDRVIVDGFQKMFVPGAPVTRCLGHRRSAPPRPRPRPPRRASRRGATWPSSSSTAPSSRG